MTVQTGIVLFDDLALTSRLVAATSKRNEKIAALAGLLRRASPSEIEIAVAFVTGTTRHGRIGVGWATIRDVDAGPAATATLTLVDVDRAIDELANTSGVGSVGRRRDVLTELLGRATAPEQQMIRSMIGGELRQGALDGVVTAAVAKAAGVEVDDVRRAAMFAGSLTVAAHVALIDGAAGLHRVALTPSRPVQPMLASPAVDVAEALAGTGPASVEWKLDGARIQAHRADGDVRLFTRNLNDVTDRLGGRGRGRAFAARRRSRARRRGAGRRRDGFAATVPGHDGRLRRRAVPDGDGRGRGLQAFFFDVLHAGASVVDEPLAVRRELLAEIVPAASRLPSIVTADADRGAAVPRRCDRGRARRA